MKRILVYPCGTEIGLEIYRALCYSTHYEIYGGSSSYDHGRFVYGRHIDHLPFITDKSTASEIESFNAAISQYSFDYIYPAMDGVVTVFSKYRDYLTPTVIAPACETAEITRSKRKTYQLLRDVLPVPKVYENAASVDRFPVFIKPDVGQGSVGAKKITSKEELLDVDFDRYVCMEYLPGEEYTVDCFTNEKGELLYAAGRERKRVKNGISVNTSFVENPLFDRYAQIINGRLRQTGGWFFQVKYAQDGALRLLEVASRVAGTSSITRCLGVNLPLLTVNVFDGHAISDVIPNHYSIEVDRALMNVYKLDLDYGTVYIDYDDTLVERGVINTEAVRFLYQCVNKGIRIILLSKHDGDLTEELRRYRMRELFDDVIHIERAKNKYEYVTEKDAVFIDDSYGERNAVKEHCGIPVFDTHMIECLLEEKR